MKNPNIIIVGCGIYGITFAERMAQAGFKILILEKRNHIGGNCYSELDKTTDVEVHKYGSHIFHTSDKEVWNYLNSFTKFNDFKLRVMTTFKNKVYSLSINLATINSFYNLNLKPSEAERFIENMTLEYKNINYSNFEGKALAPIGEDLYNAFIKGYTWKQWEKDPVELPESIINRLPVRFNYNNRYFNDRYEGIPINGYTILFENMLDNPNIEVQLGVNYFDVKKELKDVPVLFTGPVDSFFNYEKGRLEWRTVDFEKRVHQESDYQGCALMNYADGNVPFTRIHEFKHFHPERRYTAGTVTFKEFSRAAGVEDEPYYPINTSRNKKLLNLYKEKSWSLNNIIFGGRLGLYKYFDMDDAVKHALNLSKECLKNRIF